MQIFLFVGMGRNVFKWKVECSYILLFSRIQNYWTFVETCQNSFRTLNFRNNLPIYENVSDFFDATLCIFLLFLSFIPTCAPLIRIFLSQLHRTQKSPAKHISSFTFKVNQHKFGTRNFVHSPLKLEIGLKKESKMVRRLEKQTHSCF